MPRPVVARSQGPYEVRVSAHSVRWPDCCACCGGPAGGFRAVPLGGRPGAPSWDVPYCRRCSDHAARCEAGRGLLEAEPTSAWPVWLLVGLNTFLLGFGLLAAGWPAAFAAAALAGAGLLALVHARNWLVRRRHAAGRALMREAAGWAGRDCCAAGDAVLYEGRYRSTHVFLFAGADYADRFRRENAADVVP